MAITFTKAEIKEFLEDQGFDVSDEETLKKFIHDLKKLIKYEEMKKRRQRLGHHPEETNLDSTEDSSRVHETSGETSTSSGKHQRHHHHHHHHHPPPDEEDRDHRGKGRDQKRDSGGGSRQNRSPRSSKTSPEKVVGHQPDQHRRRSSSSPPGPSRKRSAEKQGKGNKPGYGGDDGRGRDVVDNKAAPSTSVNKVPKPQSRPPTNPLSARSSKENASGRGGAGKPGKRMVMRRVTATTDDNGEAILQESDIDLGPAKRSGNIRSQKTRPQTAPARPFRKPTPSDRQYKRGDEAMGREESSRSRDPVSAREKLKESSNVNNKPSRPTSERRDRDKDADDCSSMEPDELFYVLREIMFPEDASDGSGESLFSDQPKPKKLLKPPPHVAIDPVALFHWYKKNSWDVHSVPGEDRHMKLRWNVRAKTIGGYHQCV